MVVSGWLSGRSQTGPTPASPRLMVNCGRCSMGDSTTATGSLQHSPPALGRRPQMRVGRRAARVRLREVGPRLRLPHAGRLLVLFVGCQGPAAALRQGSFRRKALVLRPCRQRPGCFQCASLAETLSGRLAHATSRGHRRLPAVWRLCRAIADGVSRYFARPSGPSSELLVGTRFHTRESLLGSGGWRPYPLRRPAGVCRAVFPSIAGRCRGPCHERSVLVS